MGVGDVRVNKIKLVLRNKNKNKVICIFFNSFCKRNPSKFQKMEEAFDP